MVRAQGVEVVSSADLIQQFQARWTADQLNSHFQAAERVDQARAESFEYIGQKLRAEGSVSEFEVQQFIRMRFEQKGLTTDHGPIVAANANASDPHYEPTKESSSLIKPGDLVLIDMWAKLKAPNAVYYDITWTGFAGVAVPDDVRRVFEAVKGARKRASDFVISRVASGQELAGYEVDDVARGFIDSSGYGDFFFHRTGHNIGTEVHGTGANMDNFESHDERRVISGTCFSIEPGIYLPAFGVRSEVNVYVGVGWARVTGQEQTALVRIDC
jgi:Xaa-Pro aminopeptidase